MGTSSLTTTLHCCMHPGVEDDGYPKGLAAADLEASLATLHVMAASLRAAANLVRLSTAADEPGCPSASVQQDVTM